MNASLYEEDQTFEGTWEGAFGIAVAVVVGVSLVLALAAGPPLTTSLVVALGVGLLVAVGLPLLLWLTKLSVRVEPGHLRFRFFPFSDRDVPLERVAGWEVLTYRPFLDYCGHGVRYSTRLGWAYNVKGNRGVQLLLTDGSRMLLGSQHPEELAAALERARTPAPEEKTSE